MPPDFCVLSDFTLVTALGAGRAENLAALRAERSALAPCRFDTLPFPAYVGEIDGLDDVALPTALQKFDCRNNRLAWLTLQQDGFLQSIAAARERHGPARIGVFLGTSTSGLEETERAYRARDALTGALPETFDYARTQNTYSLAAFLRAACGLAGPAFVVSTACAATAKIFANAARMIAAGICDAALIGGADSLCATTLFGFQALGVMAETPCRPFDAARRGISIGEAAGFLLLERTAPGQDPDAILLRGVGESSDAYHMSTPHPEGLGALRAMSQALAAAGLAPSAIDYINLHGTATLVGDAAEDAAVTKLFGSTTRCSSTKGFTGHTLGAAGAIEAIFSAFAIQHDFMPGSPHTQTLDPAFNINYLLKNQEARVTNVLSNSFGFGGVNGSLVLGRAG
jgi:3-oxoacyl-[acyl-carrier-protein] synthase-1